MLRRQRGAVLRCGRMDYRDLVNEAKRSGFYVLPSRPGAHRVLCDDASGLTLLIRSPSAGNERALWPGRLPMVVAFECESDEGATERLTILETARFATVHHLLHLVRAYSALARARGCVLSEASLDADALEDLHATVRGLSATPQPQASAGFLDAVIAYTDDVQSRLQLVSST